MLQSKQEYIIEWWVGVEAYWPRPYLKDSLYSEMIYYSVKSG